MQSTPTTPEQAAATEDGVQALFAGLFEEGRTFRYSLVRTNGEEGGPPVQSEMTCRVAGVRPMARGPVSQVDCEGGDPQYDVQASPQGLYLLDPTGLYSVDAPSDLSSLTDEGLSELRPEQLLLGSPPTAGRTRQSFPGRSDGDGEDGAFAFERTVTEEAGVFCTSLESVGGDDDRRTLCLSAEGGPVRGSYEYLAGAGWAIRWQTAETTLLPLSVECVADPTPLTPTDGPLACEEAEGERGAPVVRIGYRQGERVIGATCTREASGGEVDSSPMAVEATLGGRPVIVVTDAATCMSTCECEEPLEEEEPGEGGELCRCESAVSYLWVLDRDLGFVAGAMDFAGGAMHVEGDTVVVGNARRTLRDGALVEP